MTKYHVKNKLDINKYQRGMTILFLLCGLIFCGYSLYNYNEVPTLFSIVGMVIVNLVLSGMLSYCLIYIFFHETYIEIKEKQVKK